MDNLFTPSAKSVLAIVQKQAKYFKHQTVGTEHLLLALTIEKNGIANKVLRQFSITEEDVHEEIERLIGYGTISNSEKDTYLPYSPKVQEMLSVAGEEAERVGATKIGTEHILLALLSDEAILSSRILMNLNIDLSQARKIILRKLGVNENQERRRSNKRLRNSTEGTPTLDSLANDLTQLARDNRMDPTIGRDKEVKRVIQILSRRTKNNPVLIGEPGVGKTAIAEGLAQRIITGDVPEDMQNKRLMALDMGSIVAGTKYRGEFEDRLKKVIEEIKKDSHVIIFIDELHTLIGAGGAEGAIDASNILKPALARGDLQTIGATTLDEYQKYIESDNALERRFATVQVDEPTKSEAKQILLGLRSRYENYHRVTITDDAVDKAVDLSSRYISNRFLPDKAIDLMDESSAKVRIDNMGAISNLSNDETKLSLLSNEREKAILKQQFEEAARLRNEEFSLREKIKEKSVESVDHKYQLKITGEDVAEVVSEWTGVPTGQLKKNDQDRLINLENILHKRVIGQKKAVSAVSRAIRRARSGLKDPNRPIGSFMFLGPTGVGKTELAKSLAEAMFGSEDNIIRVDMSEYMEKYSTSRLIGSAPGYIGYDEGGQLTEKIRQKPYSVVLFDEIEKAHPDVFNLLLQVLDDGFLTDSKGRRIDFRNTILIMTSNIGATTLRDEKTVGFGAEDLSDNYEAMANIIKKSLKNTFRPEFLNRIDELVIFHSLNKVELHRIVKWMAQKLLQRITDKGIQVKITPAAIDVVANAGFDPEYGARPLRRALQTKIEDLFSEDLLSGIIKPGDQITIGANRGQIRITSKSRVSGYHQVPVTSK